LPDQSSSTIGATQGSTSTTGATTRADTNSSSSNIASATTGADVTTRITEWRLSESELQADLDRGVTIVRTKETVVGAPTGNSDDQVIKTMVKGKLQADSETSKAMIDADASKGEVMLKGTADSASQIGRAIALALDTQGVSKVSANIKVSGAAKQ